MPCRTIDLGNGAFAIAYSRGQRSKPCSVCGRRGEKPCDYPLTGDKSGKTCDRSLCRNCAVSRGNDVDYCPAHARMVAA